MFTVIQQQRSYTQQHEERQEKKRRKEEMEQTKLCAESTMFEAEDQEASLAPKIYTDLCSPESSHWGVHDDPDVPPLMRTDSTYLTKTYLESISMVSEESLSIIESSGDEYIPSQRSAQGSTGPVDLSTSTGQQPKSDCGDRKTETPKRRYWDLQEVHAVETWLMAFIQSGKVPGKKECVACIKNSPQALKNRSWTAVKFYVKNRITAIQRESARRIY